MILAAQRAGVSDALYEELSTSQAALLAGFARGVPDMFSKAYRWVAEMREISGFAGSDSAEQEPAGLRRRQEGQRRKRHVLVDSDERALLMQVHVGFVVLPKRWIVERFLAWVNRNHRLAKDFEASIASAAAFVYAAAVMLLIRRIDRRT
jgi:Domain of unknown function (DUF1932)